MTRGASWSLAMAVAMPVAACSTGSPSEAPRHADADASLSDGSIDALCAGSACEPDASRDGRPIAITSEANAHPREVDATADSATDAMLDAPFDSRASDANREADAPIEAPLPPPTDPACAPKDGMLVCKVAVGSYDVGPVDNQAVRLDNVASVSLQINSGQAVATDATEWSEWCFCLDDFAVEQKTAGIGEVGCVTRSPGGTFPLLTWDAGAAVGLAVAPGQSVFLNSNWGHKQGPTTYHLVVAPQTSGIFAYRQPRKDEVIGCDSTAHQTAWAPWKNDSSIAWHTDGALIYAESPAGHQVDSGCVYVLDGADNIRSKHCTGANVPGHLTFATETIAPGESIAAQATNTCASGVWDYVAYLRVWN